jgi:hypothetical protein
MKLWWRFTMPSTMESPKAISLPSGFVVKNGSKYAGECFHPSPDHYPQLRCRGIPICNFRKALSHFIAGNDSGAQSKSSQFAMASLASTQGFSNTWFS